MKVAEWIEETSSLKREIEQATSAAQKRAGNALPLLMQRLDNEATAAQIGELLRQNGLAIVKATERCPVENDPKAFVHELGEKLGRPAGLVFSMSFTTQMMQKTRHMLTGYWTADSLRILDPNSGEYYCPRTDAGLLIRSLESRYSAEGAHIVDIQAFQVAEM